MACGPATDLLQDLAESSAAQQVSNDGSFKPQSSQRIWDKPVKLNLALLQGGTLLPHSAKVTRQLFASGRNLPKDVQNRAAMRKTLAVLPKHGPSFSIRRLSDKYKAPSAQTRNMVNRNKPCVGQAHHPSNKQESKMYQQKTQEAVRKTQNFSGIMNQQKTQGAVRKTQNFSGKMNQQKTQGAVIKTVNFSERTAKKGVSKIPSVRSQNKGSFATSCQVKRDIPHLVNLENSVNLLNVDDIEEKILKESSLLNSQILKHTLKNTGGDSAHDTRNEQRILAEQTAINEKLKNIDEKLNKTLLELSDLKEVIKNLSSNREAGSSCSCQRRNSQKAIANVKATSNSEHIVSEALSNEQSFVCTETDNTVKDSETASYSLRRSERLNSKDAQYAYESLRKSTKLLTTPQLHSTRKTNTPGRISRKVIAQLNELYGD